MTAEAAVEVIQYRLVAQKRACDIKGTSYYRNSQRWDDLPEQPKTLPEVVGTHAEVSAAAIKLNEAQIRNSFLDYLYSPDLVGAKPAPSAGDIA